MQISQNCLFILLSAVLLCSCKKEELLSKESSVLLKIDTLYYSDPGLGDVFLLDGESNADAIITDQHVYSLVFIDKAVLSRSIELVKFDIASGEIKWQWNDFVTADRGYPTKLVLSNGKILLQSEKVYVLDAETGSTEYVYTPPGGMLLQSASLHQDLIYLSLSGPEEARLMQMKVDGSQPQVLYEIDSSRTFAQAVEVLTLSNCDLLLWEVVFRDGGSSSIQLFHKDLIRGTDFKKYVVGSGNGYPSYLPAAILKESESDQVFIHTSNGLTLSMDFKNHFPLQWLHAHGGNVLRQNTEFLYAFSRYQFAMYDKSTGNQMYKSESLYKPFCASDDFVLVQGGWNKGFRVYDATTMQPIASAGGASIPVMYHLGENEFFFSDRHFDGHWRPNIGVLRISRLQP